MTSSGTTRSRNVIGAVKQATGYPYSMPGFMREDIKHVTLGPRLRIQFIDSAQYVHFIGQTGILVQVAT